MNIKIYKKNQKDKKNLIVLGKLESYLFCRDGIQFTISNTNEMKIYIRACK